MASSSSSTVIDVEASRAGASTDDQRARTVIAVTGALIGLASTVAGPYLSFRPNRVIDGISATGLDALGAAGWLLVALWILIGTMALISNGRAVVILRGLAGVAILGVLLVGSGAAAAAFALDEGAVARTSFSLSFYLSLVALFLVQYATMAELDSRLDRSLIMVGSIAVVVLVTLSGSIAELGMVREWQLTRNTFMREFRRYLFYALGSTALATALGVPLGLLAARSKRAEAGIMGTLSFGQVFPALAFIGIMMPILGGLTSRFPILREFGISGIGWAPVFVVLVIYALFPITRNTTAAIQQLDPSVLDAARGMGMGRWRLLAEIELPLAFPIVLAGIRIALVQGTAGAILAALVGGGGLGAIMFIGLEQTSMDLVLVGVIPIVALALSFDMALRAIERMTGGTGVQSI